jgi:broad-like protein
VNHHPSFTDKLVEDALFPQTPSPQLNNLHHPANVHSGATVNQLLRRAAQAAAMRRERNNSNHSDELSMKRHRLSNDASAGLLGNNNNLDTVNQHMPQITAADFSTTLKHNNNLSPHIKDQDRHDNKTPNGTSPQ